MTQPISRRAVSKAGVWSTPVVAASVAVPAYAASQRNPRRSVRCVRQRTEQRRLRRLRVLQQHRHHQPGDPEAHFTATTNPDSDINWDDATSKPKYTTYVNGEGKFTPRHQLPDRR